MVGCWECVLCGILSAQLIICFVLVGVLPIGSVVLVRFIDLDADCCDAGGDIIVVGLYVRMSLTMNMCKSVILYVPNCVCLLYANHRIQRAE